MTLRAAFAMKKVRQVWGATPDKLMLPVKRRQGEKYYFSPCALKTKLTNSRYPIPHTGTS